MPQPFAVTNATLLTGDLDYPSLPGRTVVADAAGRITQVGTAAEVTVPDGCRTIDGTGRFVMPGLINAHAHLFADGKPLPKILLNPRTEKVVSAFGRSWPGQRLFTARTRANVNTQLHSGVTTLRSVGDVAYEVVKVASEIDSGMRIGPRILPSGPLLAITGGHGAPQIALIGDTPEQSRANARRNLDRGVKAIKVCATAGVTDAREVGYAGRQEMSQDLMRAVCEEAHRAGVKVAAHAQGQEGIKAALRAGVDSIEHGSAMDQEMIDLFCDNPLSLHGRSALIPTLQAALPLVKLDQHVTGANDIVKANAEMILDGMIHGIHDALEHGIQLGMGTDSALTYVTHYNTWREMDLLVRFGGLTTTQVLHAATHTNAEILDLTDTIGSIEVGKAADLLVLDTDPLADIRALAQPVSVVIGGHIIDDPTINRFTDIDTLLDSI